MAEFRIKTKTVNAEDLKVANTIVSGNEQYVITKLGKRGKFITVVGTNQYYAEFYPKQKISIKKT